MSEIALPKSEIELRSAVVHSDNERVQAGEKLLAMETLTNDSLRTLLEHCPELCLKAGQRLLKQNPQPRDLKAVIKHTESPKTEIQAEALELRDKAEQLLRLFQAPAC